MSLNVANRIWPASIAEGQGLVGDRKPQTWRPELPAGTTIISADSHIVLSEDIWKGRTPATLRERMPTIYWDDQLGFFQIAVGGNPIFPASQAAFWNSMDKMEGARSSNLPAHIADITAEGVEKEIIAPQSMALFFKWPDFEAREWIFRGYNEYMAGLQRQEPDRIFPVAISNYWDSSQARPWIYGIRELGLKAVMLPFDPGNRPDGTKIAYSQPEFEPMWQALEETGLTVYFHIGENAVPEPGPNGWAASVLKSLAAPFRPALGALIFGGVFDRFPRLKVVFAEAGINWVPGFLQDAELVFDTHCELTESRPRHRPSHYWHTNCYATFMADQVGLTQLDIIGRDRVMWGHDYPHSEGTFGFAGSAIAQVIDTVGDDAAARAILGGTAARVFGLDSR